MNKLKPAELFTLEVYARERPAFRARVIAHKRLRQVAVGPNCTWCFEDRLTIQYQIQEMLRTERIFEAEGIDGELSAYNPLIPDGGNWKVTESQLDGAGGATLKRLPAHRAFWFGWYAAYPGTRLVK